MSEPNKPSRTTAATTHKKTAGVAKTTPARSASSTGKGTASSTQPVKEAASTRKAGSVPNVSRTAKRPATAKTSPKEDAAFTPQPAKDRALVPESVPVAETTVAMQSPAVAQATVESIEEEAIVPSETQPAAPAHQEPAPSQPTEMPLHELTSSISTDPSDVADVDTTVEPGAHPDITDELDELPVEENLDLDEVRVQLTALQQQIRAAKIPVVIVVEGWGASGKGTMVTKLIEGLDPRGYQVYPIRKATPEESAFPRMRRYWVNMPRLPLLPSAPAGCAHRRR